jgi:hypothetical protein
MIGKILMADDLISALFSKIRSMRESMVNRDRDRAGPLILDPMTMVNGLGRALLLKCGVMNGRGAVKGMRSVL